MIRPSGVSVAVLNQVNSAFKQLGSSASRLSTLRRVNSGRDDPAGLIASGRLRDELAALEAASRNTSRASSVIRLADSGLEQVGGLLRTVRANAVTAANSTLGNGEREALQIETNAALEAINRIGNTTSFGDTRLLDGSNPELTLALSGDPANTATLELPQISASSLGGDAGHLDALFAGGAANLVDGDLARSTAIVDAARDQVLQGRARLGAFEKFTIDSTSQVIDTTIENLTGALSQIVDVNVAQESSTFLRARILADVSLTALRTASKRDRLVRSILS